MKFLPVIALFALLGCAANKPAVKQANAVGDDTKCENFYKINEAASKDLEIKFEELNKEFEISKFTGNKVCLETIICNKKAYCITWENINQ